MPNSKISTKVLAELNRQVNQELNAAQEYLALSLWCDLRNFTGFASFFAKQAAEEREHAAKSTKHLLDRGVSPQLAAIPAPKQAYKTLPDLALQAQAMEQANTQGINAAYEAAFAAKDFAAQVLLHWFINEQVEEEAWAARWLTACKLPLVPAAFRMWTGISKDTWPTKPRQADWREPARQVRISTAALVPARLLSGASSLVAGFAPLASYTSGKCDKIGKRR